MQTKARDTHVVSQAKEKEYMRLSKAFGIDSRSEQGSAFNWHKEKEEKLKRQAEREAYASRQAVEQLPRDPNEGRDEVEGEEREERR